ncbi:hypothetical protein PMIN04_001775 [Paraphaeosphaeria minitans]|uniref:Ecp2 effector protein domain-containing protein n=1 Tax=Paraphaeosphaeria minitans TaxID=565426 RepID=A0A9P6GS97_9PLEO|nr:hypothetical protein PMIN01_02840 [Paraphaeosphaeria minitans]
MPFFTSRLTSPTPFLLVCFLLPILPTSALPTLTNTTTTTTRINAYVENNCVFPIHALQSWCDGAGGTAHISPHTGIWFGHESGRDGCGVSIALTLGEEGDGDGDGESEALNELKRRMYEVGYQIDGDGSMLYGLGKYGGSAGEHVVGRLEVEGMGCAPVVDDAGRVRRGEESCGRAGDVRFYLC